MKGICPLSQTALTRDINIFIHSFSLPLITYELIHPDKPALPRNLNIISLRIYDSMNSQLQNFIAQSLSLQQKLFERNKSRKWKLDQK